MSAAIQKSGFLEKQGAGGLKLWQERYFVIRGSTLYWYKKRGDRNHAGSCLLVGVPVRYMENTNIFRVCTHKEYILKAASVEERKEWIESMQAVGAVLVQYRDDPKIIKRNSNSAEDSFTARLRVKSKRIRSRSDTDAQRKALSQTILLNPGSNRSSDNTQAPTKTLRKTTNSSNYRSEIEPAHPFSPQASAPDLYRLRSITEVPRLGRAHGSPTEASSPSTSSQDLSNVCNDSEFDMPCDTAIAESFDGLPSVSQSSSTSSVLSSPSTTRIQLSRSIFSPSEARLSLKCLEREVTKIEAGVSLQQINTKLDEPDDKSTDGAEDESEIQYPELVVYEHISPPLSPRNYRMDSFVVEETTVTASSSGSCEQVKCH